MKRSAPAIIAGIFLFSTVALADVEARDTGDTIILRNDLLSASVDKGRGAISDLFLGEQDLLGPVSGSTGLGPYLDCHCAPEGFYTPGGIDPYYEVFTGADSTGTEYGGFLMGEVHPETGQIMEQYIFLRDGEAGLHMFSRVAYYNEEKPYLRDLGELRTMFRPNTDLWTHLSTNEDLYAPIPNLDDATVVQDATWKLTNQEEPYVQEFSQFFTKYTFQSTWRDHKVHGQFADGSHSVDGSTYGAWLIMNTQDTYFGGPTHSDLVVDGIVYNYMISNHHGAGVPNMTHGFDRTFGPAFYFFNKGESSATISDLRAETAQFTSPEWNAEFYDAIADYVPNYVPSSGRGSFTAEIALPEGAKRPIAILTVGGANYQDNAVDTKAYQYWGDIDESGKVSIPRVKAGTYRLTIFADDIFGDYIQEGIEVVAGEETTVSVNWEPERAGTELWRIGTPDKSSGEYRHGNAPDENYPLQPSQFRIYWGAWDFPTDFPEGVRFKVGESDPGRDLNYIHWSFFGGKGNSERPEPYYENVNNWTILFDASQSDLQDKTQATFTVQLAGAKTANGNLDSWNAEEPWVNLPLTVNVNGNDLEPWIIPFNRSSSCGVRSAVSCHNLAHRYQFATDLLKMDEENELVLSLPPRASNTEPAQLPESCYIQYDAMRFEVE
ncbi:hypothetical protein AJ79_09877 [Helicocarpus griseus UAMH5409]|uniref:rhamnogalacturonan endolyase n=1 Tax=Helicocarpus griseus UAMH5409 TaxID=1447875 RepID=A0A2B7WGX3_9EURO|nr:hypothetical protein AJ79_09877 [Helicocarpus griseus UAMH5409]